MEYLSSDDIIYINQTQVGPNMLRDPGLLDTAVNRPTQAVYGVELFPDIHTKAAALTEALVQYHPFVDGNKRTAFIADVVFYGLNGYDLDIPDPQTAADFIVDIAVHRFADVEKIASHQSQWVRPKA